MSNSSEYKQNFYTWVSKQAHALASHGIECSNWKYPAQRLVSVEISQKNEIKSWLVTLLAHLLKWQSPSGHRSVGSLTALAYQRDDLQYVLKENESLRQYDFPYMIEKVLDSDFLCNSTLGFESIIGKGNNL
ncbi:protein of unknown function DUF29 [Synechococcus sp. PCC 6312]|nr:protein of unknown function DUF29 [Synechococcus sp. PCC 6312]